MKPGRWVTQTRFVGDFKEWYICSGCIAIHEQASRICTACGAVGSHGEPVIMRSVSQELMRPTFFGKGERCAEVSRHAYETPDGVILHATPGRDWPSL